jgi:hypothetical protein
MPAPSRAAVCASTTTSPPRASGAIAARPATAGPASTSMRRMRGSPTEKRRNDPVATTTLTAGGAAPSRRRATIACCIARPQRSALVPSSASKQHAIASPSNSTTLPPARSTSVISGAYTRSRTAATSSAPRWGPCRCARASVSGVKPDTSASSTEPCRLSAGVTPLTIALRTSAGTNVARLDSIPIGACTVGVSRATRAWTTIALCTTTHSRCDRLHGARPRRASTVTSMLTDTEARTAVAPSASLHRLHEPRIGAVEIRVLGEVEAVGPCGVFALGRTRPGALLAMLVIHAGECVPVDRLVEELWSEESAARGAKRVQVNVLRLRRGLARVTPELDPGALVRTGSHGYSLVHRSGGVAPQGIDVADDDAATPGLDPAELAQQPHRLGDGLTRRRRPRGELLLRQGERHLDPVLAVLAEALAHLHQPAGDTADDVVAGELQARLVGGLEAIDEHEHEVHRRARVALEELPERG